MGFSGYYQVLCKNGHDMGGHDVYGKPCKVCRYCGADIGWENMVDTTNGSEHHIDTIYDEDDFPEDIYCTGCKDCDNGRIDGYVELEKIQEAVRCTCTFCGHNHIASPPKYKIPTDKGRIA